MAWCLLLFALSLSLAPRWMHQCGTHGSFCECPYVVGLGGIIFVSISLLCSIFFPTTHFQCRFDFYFETHKPKTRKLVVFAKRAIMQHTQLLWIDYNCTCFSFVCVCVCVSPPIIIVLKSVFQLGVKHIRIRCRFQTNYSDSALDFHLNKLRTKMESFDGVMLSVSSNVLLFVHNSQRIQWNIEWIRDKRHHTFCKHYDNIHFSWL